MLGWYYVCSYRTLAADGWSWKKVLIKIDIIFTSLLESDRLTTYITGIKYNNY